MNTNWSRLEDIFAQAIELAPDQRPAFLDLECASAPELRQEVESLLQVHEQAEASFSSRSVAVRDILGAIGSAFLAGKMLGVYRMEAIVGEGGMGIVYQAVDTRGSRHVAVKVLPHEFALDSPWRRRFSREVRTTAAIRHPNVVRILDYGEDSGSLFLVMELIEGQNLRACLAHGALPLDKVLDYGIQIAAALEAAHAAGVIHHDLKPGNIMVTPDEQLKVVDFGLSRFEDDSGADSSRSRLTQIGTPAGTVDYLSPEQAGGRRVDTRSDLFAMGSVLYEMLSGHRAFHRSTNLETAAAILRDQPEPLPESVPAALAALVDKCLAKDPARRIQSAAQLRQELEALRDKLRGGRLKPQRFRRARRMALRAIPAIVVAAALLAFAVYRSRAPARRAPRFERLTDDPHVTMEPALSLDGRWLAYASDRAEDGNVDIWIQSTGQGNPRRLTNHPALDHEPALSPDGSLLAFRSEREPAGVYEMSLLDGHERLLAAAGRGPQFSPDGKWIAYWSGPEVNGDEQAVMHTAIFVTPAAGGTPRRLAAGFVAASHPVWSPDSDGLLFAGHREANRMAAEFWWAPLDGGTPRLKATWLKDQGNTIAPPIPCAWPRNDWLLLRWLRMGQFHMATHIWSMRFPKHPQTEEPVPEQLTSGAGTYTGCSADRTGRIVVASGIRRSAIWSLPIDPDTAQLHGGLAPFALEGERADFPSMSADGKLMLFQATDPRGLQHWILRSFASGTDATIKSGKGTRPMLLTRDGRSVDTVITDGAVWPEVLSLPPALKARSFPAVRFIWDLSRDGTLALSTGYSRPRGVTLGSAGTEHVEVVLQHPAFSLYVPFFSPDDHWIVVTAINGVDPPRLFAAPFRPPYPIPVSEWIDLGEGLFARWAPSGNRIYFLRDHLGSRCIYTRALDPLTKRPLSDAVAVLHMHSAWRSPMQLDPGFFRMIAAPDRLVFPLGELRSKLWVAQP
ncbi:MAG TPA: protein kinase [Bryobacteraceae bacterium]|nr:protein kinase [Bryobacteraceae bacterium]